MKKSIINSYKKNIIICIIACISCNINFAQKTDANIHGHVLDHSTKEHLPFVNVFIKGSTIGTATDESGHYHLSNLPEGAHTVVVSLVGYKQKEQTVTLNRKSSVEVNFEIEENAILMKDIVVSANRCEVDRKEAATVVNVLSPMLFENTNSCNLAEGLNFQSGLRVENTCQNCGSNAVRINGLEGKYSQILIDSRPIFNSLSGVYGLEQIPASMIDRVEIIRGGGSAIFGSNAIGGVINIITKEPLRNSLELSNTTNYIGNKSWDNITSMNAALVSSNRKVGAYIYGMSRNREGYDNDNDGFTEIGKLRGLSLGFRSYYKISNQSKITAEYHTMYEYRRGGDSLELLPHQVLVAEQAEHHIHGGGLHYDFISKDTKTQISIFSSLQKINRDTYYGTQYDINAYGNSNDLSSVTGAQFNYAFDKLIFMPSQFVTGVEYSINKLEDIQLSYNRTLHQNVYIASAFAQNEWKNKTFGLLIGLRADKHNLVDNVVLSPRANVRYAISKSLTGRLSYSSGFRAPQAFDEDLHIMAVGGTVSLINLSEDLKPEYSNSYSGSLDWTHEFGYLLTSILMEGFYTNLNNVFILTEKGTDMNGNLLLERSNGSGAYVAGLNTEVRFSLFEKFNFQLGYTYQQSRYKKAETWSKNPSIKPQKRMFRTPDHYGYFTTDYTFSNKLKIALSGTYTGKMLIQHYKGYIEEDQEVETQNFFDLNIKIAYSFQLSNNSTLQLNAGVQNLFNSYQSDFDKGAYRDAGYIYGPGLPRTFFFGIKLSI